MCCDYFTDASDQVTIRCELAAGEQGLEFRHDSVKAANQLWNLVDRVRRKIVHETEGSSQSNVNGMVR